MFLMKCISFMELNFCFVFVVAQKYQELSFTATCMLLHNMYLLDMTNKIMMCKDCASVCVCTSKYKAVIMYELDVVVWMIQWKFVSLCLMFKHTGIKCTAIIYSQFGSNCTITSWFSVRDLHNYMQYFWNQKYMFKCFWIIFESVTYR